MAVNVSAIDTEVRTVAQQLQTSWSDFAIYCKAKLFECGINGGISSYTINGRTVTKDLQFWERALELANRMAAQDAGGVVDVPIRFRSRS